MAFRRNLGFGHSRQVRPPLVLGIAGDSGQAMRGSSATDAPTNVGNAGPRKNTWWCYPLHQHRQP